MPRYLWSIPLMFVVGVVIGKVAIGQSWPISIGAGFVLTILFNGVFWLTENRTKKEPLKKPEKDI